MKNIRLIWMEDIKMWYLDKYTYEDIYNFTKSPFCPAATVDGKNFYYESYLPVGTFWSWCRENNYKLEVVL